MRKQSEDGYKPLIRGLLAVSFITAVYFGILVMTPKTSRNNLEKLFDSQIATLKDRGTPEQIVKMLQNQKGEVLMKATEMSIGEGNILFLPVVPRTFRAPHDLMAMVRHNDKAGYTYLNPIKLSDVVEVPNEPYYIYDVEDGQATLGKSSEQAEKILKAQERSPLTATEVMALATHADVLSRHYVWAIGSRYESAGRVPAVYLGGGRPGLDWGGIRSPDRDGGSPSCHRQVNLR